MPKFYCSGTTLRSSDQEGIFHDVYIGEAITETFLVSIIEKVKKGGNFSNDDTITIGFIVQLEKEPKDATT